ncbi:exodeoxyribonuclease VII large subunit [Alkalihalobacillus trypoxylicola]|uniref:Exodeoxyribonuclease 7 large subunit n=1 Tax=Alkalihalobacillus trypoxylicola TaxID=519424 RepID=A0A162DVC3_9BACI|nr:exodeoxyribonuclease VII large subunit [Alkalihalobacillus trypoxylicola]KYG30951.1 exodeoxyribonuclease VII large subunit [Alkalihalobacillus trypoxylicola]
MSHSNIQTVTEITRYIKEIMENDHILQSVWIKGEISNFKRHSRGHMYFTIKDQNSRLQAVMFAGHNRFLTFKPENGMSIIVRGELTVYEPYGSYQMYVKEMQPDGIGSLYLAYEQLKTKLQQEGLFDHAYKKALPTFPNKVAIITSPTGAAVKDMISTLKRRYPIVELALFPVLVQGEHAPASILRAIEQVNILGHFDLILLGRGGGSIEELWAFNEEVVARAIFESNTPIISAVGHETDFTISDLVADLRAPTPTGAAELAVPDKKELLHRIEQLQNRMMRKVNEQLFSQKRALERIERSYAFKYPAQLIQQKEQELDTLLERLNRAMSQQLNDKNNKITQLYQLLIRNHPKDKIDELKKDLIRQEERLLSKINETFTWKRSQFQSLLTQLNLVSPLKVMERGYSLVYDEQKSLIKKTSQVQSGDSIQIHVTDGQLKCDVVEVVKK